MTNHEIEKLAQAYAGQHETRCKENQFHLAISFMELRAAFIAGYLKGVEAERKRCIEITNKIIEKEVSPFGARSIKEQIERGDK